MKLEISNLKNLILLLKRQHPGKSMLRQKKRKKMILLLQKRALSGMVGRQISSVQIETRDTELERIFKTW